MGHEVIVSGFLGATNRQIFDDHFKEAQFQPEFIYIEGETRQNIKIAEHSGRMTDLNGKGFFISELDKKNLFQKNRDDFASGRCGCYCWKPTTRF